MKILRLREKEKMSNNKNYYNEKFNNFNEEEQRLDKKYSQISTLRIISFLLGFALLLIGIFDDKLSAGIRKKLKARSR